MAKVPPRPDGSKSASATAGRTDPVRRTSSGEHSRVGRGALLGGVLVVALLAAGAGMMWMAQNPANSTAPLGGASIGGPFQLTEGVVPSAGATSGAVKAVSSGASSPRAGADLDGRAVTDRDFRGKFMLVYFGYTFCPDVCPTTLTDVAQALDRLGKSADQLQAVFITVDPKRDTPPVVAQYAAAFSPRLVGLTGTPEQIAAVAHEYRVYYAEHRTGPGPNDYSMDHSSILYLMGRDGSFVGVIRADSGPEAIAAELAKYLGTA